MDSPKGIDKYLPDEYKDRVVYVSHETDSGEKLEERAKKLLERYGREAALVVTSRLHCASPCMAMGIPVILARKYFDPRYEWIGKYLTLYTPDLFPEIDRNPQPVELEKEKEKTKTPIKMWCYMKVIGMNPKLAYFIRKNILRKFTVISGGQKEKKDI